MLIDRLIFDRIDEVVAPFALRVVEVKATNRALEVRLEREDCSSPGIDEIAAVTSLISEALEGVSLPFAGHWELEVSSPGLERPLIRWEHFLWAVGKEVDLTRRSVGRQRGTLLRCEEADEMLTLVVSLDGVECLIPWNEIETARTVFSWGAGTAKTRTTTGGSREVKEENDGTR
ncbi:MAG: hypothetical protein ACYDHP_04475 [Ferrimicrobium sp.]